MAVSNKRRFGLIIIRILLILSGFVMIFPFVWMGLTAFKPVEEVNAYPPTFLPDEVSLDNFREVFSRVPILRYFFNSIAVTIIPICGSVFVGSLAGFIFAKERFWGHKVLFAIIVASLILPEQARIVPLYLMTLKIGWINTYHGVFYPTAMGGFSIFFMTQTIRNIPNELLDSARIDGAGLYRIYWYIVLPLVRPALATVMVFSFIFSWRMLLWPLIVLNDPEMYTIELGMATFKQEWYVEYGESMTFALIAILPIIILFWLMQRHIVSGMIRSGLKG